MNTHLDQYITVNLQVDNNLRKSGPISYTRARELLLSVLESIDLEKHHFGLHSLRSGGATAAEAAGVEDRLFKKHARWKSEKAKNDYIKEDLNQKLSVTRKFFSLVINSPFFVFRSFTVLSGELISTI